MALAVSTQELDDFAQLLMAAGITSIETSWRGFTCQFTEGMEHLAADALVALRLRIESIQGKDSRRAFVERLTEVTKERVRASASPVSNAAPLRH